MARKELASGYVALFVVMALLTARIDAADRDFMDREATKPFADGPFDREIAAAIARLRSQDEHERAAAAESLGFLRAYDAASALSRSLEDPSASVRREAALALAWCGGRGELSTLVSTLDDADWSVAQSAWVALTNLTGMEFPFDALGALQARQAQAQTWKRWCAALPAKNAPTDIIELFGRHRAEDSSDFDGRRERGVRALGALGGSGAAASVLVCLDDVLEKTDARRPSKRALIRAAFRALGRMRSDESVFDALIARLDDTYLARYAADALGDLGDPRAGTAMIAAYRRYARSVTGTRPVRLPRDDAMGFPDEDRMFETPYLLAFALSRLRLDARHLAALREIAPLLVANLPGDHDAALLYERESGQRITASLLEAAGLRQEACEQAFVHLGLPRRVPAPVNAPAFPVFAPYRVASRLPALCVNHEDLPRLVALLVHDDGWVRINAAKTIGLLGDRHGVEPVARRLRAAKTEAEYGYSGKFKDEEYADPAPRLREGLARALGRLGAVEHVPLLTRVMGQEGAVLEVRHAACQALDEIGSASAERHPFASVRSITREALWRRGEILPTALASAAHDLARLPRRQSLTEERPSFPSAIVFIKGSNVIPNTEGTVEQADRWRQTYVVTDSGPVYRPGRNIFLLSPPRPDGRVTALTKFRDGWVGDVEVSFDARRVIFSRRGAEDPWWHIFEMRADGSALTQLTDGPYHDVGPAYLPDGRIVFASSRSGSRDEYHGYPTTALFVMRGDGSGIRPIAVNIGRDNEPAVLEDGRIVFSRLEVFYSRLKTELTLHSVRPDGMRDTVIYGPERRQFWSRLDVGPRTPAHGQEAPLTHRVLRMTQPQPMPDGLRIVVSTQGGLALVEQNRGAETIIPHDKGRAFTTPFPLPDGRIVCASTWKAREKKDVDLGLYLVDPQSGDLELIYNDPEAADFEPRPLAVRPRPAVLPDKTRPRSFTGRLACASVRRTQEPLVADRGRLLRVVEGMPVVSRHSTQTNPWPVWKNHHGVLARVLGTVPLAADGSFFIEVPADRLLHLQVLDSDRRVVGNQLTWMYVRPGETKSCVGCHERSQEAPPTWSAPHALRTPPIACVSRGGEFRYRAKAWFKGRLPDVIEERTRTVRAVNLLAR